MIEVMVIGAVATVVLGAVGLIVAWSMARLMDWANNSALKNYASHWGDVISKIEKDPTASAVYYGARWLGICILIGWLFSRPV